MVITARSWSLWDEEDEDLDHQQGDEDFQHSLILIEPLPYLVESLLYLHLPLRRAAIKKAPLTPGPESHPWELNPKPGAYEASALPIELGWLLVGHIILRTAKLASEIREIHLHFFRQQIEQIKQILT